MVRGCLLLLAVELAVALVWWHTRDQTLPTSRRNTFAELWSEFRLWLVHTPKSKNMSTCWLLLKMAFNHIHGPPTPLFATQIVMSVGNFNLRLRAWPLCNDVFFYKLSTVVCYLRQKYWWLLLPRLHSIHIVYRARLVTVVGVCRRLSYVVVCNLRICNVTHRGSTRRRASSVTSR